jgi:hypothetical protein
MDAEDFGGFPEVQSDESVAQQEAQTDLDERARQDFSGLMYLGYLEDECEVVGHRFLLKTPWHEERIERGILHKPYFGSMNFEPMWELITVALYCHAIDGVAAPEPLGPRTNAVGGRLDWIKRTVYSPIVIRKIFERCLELDARERAVVEYVDDQSKS